MISYSEYVDRNIDKLSEEYDDYLKEQDDINVPLDFDEFCTNAYNSMYDDYADMEYERYKERDI